MTDRVSATRMFGNKDIVEKLKGYRNKNLQCLKTT